MNSNIIDEGVYWNMKESLFSKKTRHMLEDNGYSFRSNSDIHTFRHSSGTALGVSIFAVIVGAFNVFFIMMHPIPGIIAFIFLIVATRTVIKKLVGKTLIMIDEPSKKFTLNTPFYKADSESFDSIDAITLKSKYVDEYTSAFKSTSEEHLITIFLTLKSGKEVLLFKFSSDYSEPSDEINQVYAFLENAFSSKKLELNSL